MCAFRHHQAVIHQPCSHPRQLAVSREAVSHPIHWKVRAQLLPFIEQFIVKLALLKIGFIEIPHA